MALSEAEELELLELEEAEALAAAPKPSPEKKTSSAAEQGAARGKKLASGVLGPVTSFGAGVGGGAFELTNLVLRKAKEAQGASPEDARAYTDAVLGTLAKENPGSFSIGYGAGAAGSGAAAAKGAQALGKAVPAVGRAIKAAAPVVGKPLSNAAKLAAGGAASTAVSEANRGRSAEEVAEGAAASAGLSVALAPVVRGGGAVVNAVRSALDKNKDEGFRVLARQMRKKGSTITPEALKQRAIEHRAATGNAPAITDLLGDEGAETALNLTFRGDEASRTLANAAAKRATDLQTDLSKSIVRGRKTPAVSKLESYRTIAADNAMKKIGEEKVTFNTDAIKALTESKRVRRALPDEEREILLALEDTGGELSVRQVDNIRQALRKKGKGPGGPASRVREFANALVEDAGEQVPEYRRFLKSFARRSKAIEGAQLGRKVGTPQTTEFVAAVEGRSPAGVGGARVGARAALSDAAKRSPKGAAELARSLAEDAGLSQRLEALDPVEAEKLRRLGTAESEALRGVAKLGAGAQRNLSEKDAAASRAAIDALLSGTGVGSLSFKVSAFRRFFSANRVPPTAAAKLAEAIVDPAKTDDVLRRLAALGIEPRKVEEFARAAARASSRSVAASDSEE